MKLFKLSTAFISACAMLFFVSCNSGETKTEEAKDTTAKNETPPPPPPPPAKPSNLLVIWHKVANFNKWLPLYESHDSARTASGLHNFIVGRGTDKDSNMVMVALQMDDVEKAKQFGSSADLKAAMQKGGVIGAPKVSFLDVQMLDTSAINTPLRVVRTVKVKDWDAWKKSFDEGKQSRTDAGLMQRALGYAVGDNHTVTIAYAVSDKKKAEDFFASPETKEKMKASGVEGMPETFWYTVAKKY